MFENREERDVEKWRERERERERRNSTGEKKQEWEIGFLVCRLV